jgi:hypothetical protein
VPLGSVVPLEVEVEVEVTVEDVWRGAGPMRARGRVRSGVNHRGEQVREREGTGEAGSLHGRVRRGRLLAATAVAAAAVTASVVALVVPSTAAATPTCPDGSAPVGEAGRCAGDADAAAAPDAGSMIARTECTAFAGHRVCGLLLEHYLRLRGPDGFLGVPTSDELPAGPGGAGRVSHFQGGDIFWSPDGGAWEVHGAVEAKWATAGGPDGPLGFPVSDVAARDGVETTRFENGSVVSSARTGARTVVGPQHEGWWELDGPDGPLRLPVTDTVSAFDGRRVSFFEGGTLYWGRSGGLDVYVGPNAAPLVQEAETIDALSLADFVAVRAVRAGGEAVADLLVWSSDGCSGSLLTPASVDAFFRDACLRHDFGYRNFRAGPRIDPSPARKQRIDTMFLADLRATCATAGQPRIRWYGGVMVDCDQAARLMYRAVRLAP